MSKFRRVVERKIESPTTSDLRGLGSDGTFIDKEPLSAFLCARNINSKFHLTIQDTCRALFVTPLKPKLDSSLIFLVIGDGGPSHLYQEHIIQLLGIALILNKSFAETSFYLGTANWLNSKLLRAIKHQHIPNNLIEILESIYIESQMSESSLFLPPESCIVLKKSGIYVSSTSSGASLKTPQLNSLIKLLLARSESGLPGNNPILLKTDRDAG